LKASYCSISFFQNTACELKVNHYCTTACNANSKYEADVRDITAYRGSRGRAPPNFNHVARWKWAATLAGRIVPAEITYVPPKQDPEVALEPVRTLQIRETPCPCREVNLGLSSEQPSLCVI